MYILTITNNNTLKRKKRKKTHIRLYLHCKSFAPPTWKHSTLWSIITRVYLLNSKYLEAELLKIKHEFTQINGQSGCLIKSMKNAN